MEAAEVVTEPAEPHPRLPRPAVVAMSSTWWLAAVMLAATTAAGIWITIAAMTAGHGFDATDEGFYLLSYRWWSTNLRTFTGAQYLYGPVFQLVGYDIAALRVFRLLTVVSTLAVFGWTFMRWLRPRRPRAPASRLWEAAGTAAIVACGGMTYSWLPLSPGYNDVSLLGALLAASVVLRMARDADRGTRVPMWVPAALGPVAVAMLLAKWTSSVVTLGVLAVVGVVVLGRLGPRELIRVAAWTVAGAAGAVLFIHVVVIPLTEAVPEMLATNRLVATRTNAPAGQLDLYRRSSIRLLKAIAKGHGLLLLAAAFTVVARGPVVRRCAGALAVGGLVVSIWRLAADGALGGGNLNLERFSVGVLIMPAVAAVVGLAVLLHGRFTRSSVSSLGREGLRGWAILGMLAVLPITQAAGTWNALYAVAVNAFAAWAAVIIAVLTGIESAPAAARRLVAAVAGGAVVLTTVIVSNGLWAHPYRTAGYPRTTATAPGVPPLDSLRLEPATARAYGELRQRVRPYVEPAGRAIMAFDELAGIVLLLDGRPVGEAWNSASDPARTAAGIRAECEDGSPWWGSRSPLLLLRRPVGQTELDALRSCGLDFATDYRLLAPKEETMGLLVYVPTAEPPAGER